MPIEFAQSPYDPQPVRLWAIPVGGLPIAFFTPDQWRALPDTCHGLYGLLNRPESLPCIDADTITDALAILRELLRRRPAEFGGPMEL